MLLSIQPFSHSRTRYTRTRTKNDRCTVAANVGPTKHEARNNPLRILIYGLNYSPELTGIGKYTGELACWLAQRGHEVRVVTAPPYYPAWSISEGYRGRWYSTERPSDPCDPLVFRVPLYVPDKPSGIKRVVHLASFMLGSLPAVIRNFWWCPDVVWTVEPTFFSAPIALIAAYATGAASWLHVQDFEVDAAFDLGILPAHGPVHALALFLERIFTRNFDVVSSISRKMVERARTKGVPARKAVLFPNWVDVASIRPQPLRSEKNFFRRELNLTCKTIVLYSGNMGGKQGLELLAPLAAAFDDDDSVHFVYCGDGAFRPQLEALVGDRKNVTLLPLQPLELLNDLLGAADIHLLPQRAGAADLVMPSKLTGMLSSGRPVVATAEAGTQVAVVIQECGDEGCGLVVPAEDADALHIAIRKLIDDPALRERMGKAARKYALENLGRENVLLAFERRLAELVRDHQVLDIHRQY